MIWTSCTFLIGSIRANALTELGLEGLAGFISANDELVTGSLLKTDLSMSGSASSAYDCSGSTRFHLTPRLRSGEIVSIFP